MDIDSEDESETENIENEGLDSEEMNCIGPKNELALAKPPDAATCDEGALILLKEYEKKK